MNKRSLALVLGAGCALIALLILIPLAVIAFLIPIRVSLPEISLPGPTREVVERPQLQFTESPLFSQPVSIVPFQENADLTTLYQQANPGVVTIDVQVTQRGATEEGAGSGFILSQDGYIATNYHVVVNANIVIVTFFDGSQLRADVIGADPDSDIAIIKTDQLADQAHPLPLGDSDAVQPGDWVVAIGNPFRLGGSMTVGIVSAIGRTIPSLTEFSIPQSIQTDAAINPGNSGGPLLNLRGQVIGINAQIATAGGVRASSGVGFAIPVNILKHISDSLIKEGSYSWPWLGVTGGPVDRQIMEANQLPDQHGAYIDTVVSGGPADRAGLRGSSGQQTIDGFPVPVGGDVVVAADGQAVNNFDQLLTYIASKNPGDRVNLTIIRDGGRLEVPVELEERPSNVSQ